MTGSRGPGPPEGDGGRLRVVLADDAPLIRAGVAMVLAAAGMDVVAQVGDAVALLPAVAATAPHVVISDVRMPPSHTVEGVRAAAAIARAHPGVGVLLLSNHAETRHLDTLLDGARAGVGYLLKERVVDTGSFVTAVRTVAAGGTVLDPEIVQLLVARRSRRPGLAALSDREREVLAAMATGASNAALCRQLSLSPKTVEAHTAHIFRKLGLAPDADEHRRVAAVLAHLRGG